MIEGVAAPECANNAASMGAMVPMLTLGVPGSGATAIMMGALMMLGISPGPSFFVNEADVAWGLIASMYLGNVILVCIGLGALSLFVRILNVKTSTLNALIFAFILVGAYALENSMFTVGVTLFFGLLGYILKKVGVPAAPWCWRWCWVRHRDQSETGADHDQQQFWSGHLPSHFRGHPGAGGPAGVRHPHQIPDHKTVGKKESVTGVDLMYDRAVPGYIK